ncbi:hypothetical protein BDN70DRAFT_74865 [Pholiota conissans]|uniref:Uncharacterized protein n=1 Tax=Pholiota conissans TaxID=109636 RepID=A0A9P5Z0D1_9AGAR|nr:hypothetical protein BDN70DRAFT_74865 [Pholiota conissans]
MDSTASSTSCVGGFAMLRISSQTPKVTSHALMVQYIEKFTRGRSRDSAGADIITDIDGARNGIICIVPPSSSVENIFFLRRFGEHTGFYQNRGDYQPGEQAKADMTCWSK